MRRMVLVAIALSLACEANPWVVENESVMTPPEVYFSWFQQVAFCMDRSEDATRGRFDRIGWHEGLTIEHPSEGRALGLWTRPHKITIRRDQTDVELVVKHEMVHDFLQNPDHPAAYFPRCAERQDALSWSGRRGPGSVRAPAD